MSASWHCGCRPGSKRLYVWLFCTRRPVPSAASFRLPTGVTAMKRWVIAGAGALVWMAAASPSGAADIPAAPVAKAPVMVPAAKQSWYGFYIGLHGGYGWGRNAITATPDAFYAPLFLAAGLPNTVAGNPKGFIGGITYGSNYQFDRIVVGFDSDFSYTDIKASQTINATVLGVPITTNASQKLSWFGTTRVRGGFLLSDNILLYGTGGLASGRIEANANNVVNIPGGCLLAGGCPSGAISQNLWGWAAGGGIEFARGPVAVPRRISALRSRHRELPDARRRRAAQRHQQLAQGVRRHGARRDHLPLQLDAARPDLRHRQDLISQNTRRDSKTAGPLGPAVRLVHWIVFQHFWPLERRHEPEPGCVLRSAAGCACAWSLAGTNTGANVVTAKANKRGSDQSPNHSSLPEVGLRRGKESIWRELSRRGLILPRTRPQAARFTWRNPFVEGSWFQHVALEISR